MRPRNPGMDKRPLLKKIVASLSESLEILTKAAKASHAEATHESSKAESKYDTRGLEAAYLAGGQARQAKELIESIELYESLPTKAFAADEPIDLTAVVELESDRAPSCYFIGPKNGGLEIEYKGKEVTLITPQSPLGQELVGKKAGQRWTAKLGGAMVKYHILSVS
jgi:transcription elongation GreA/GreB family factor